MKNKKGPQVGLTLIKKSTQIKGESPSQAQKDDQKNIGERRGKITIELADKNGSWQNSRSMDR